MSAISCRDVRKAVWILHSDGGRMWNCSVVKKWMGGMRGSMFPRHRVNYWNLLYMRYTNSMGREVTLQ
jgi:hypothetical protein